VTVLSRLSTVVVALLIATLLSSPAPAATYSWRSVINDQFPAGTAVPRHWNLYSGRYGSGEKNCSAPSQVFVNSDGYLVLRESYRSTGKCGAGWYTGGMKIPALSARRDRVLPPQHPHAVGQRRRLLLSRGRG
jgi:hypothetical protein